MIYLGADHGGFPLKEKVKTWLTEWKYQFQDLGAASLNPEDDFPQYALDVAEQIAPNQEKKDTWSNHDKGILFCRSAGGVIIAANKVKGIRAVATWDERSAIHAREHNDANIIALPGDWTDDETAKKIIQAFLTTAVSSEPRHLRRMRQISDYEELSSWLGQAGGGCCGGGCGGNCNH